MDPLFDLYSMGLNSICQFPIHITRMMIQLKDDNSVDQVGIDDKLTTTLEELVSLGPGQYQRHPLISKVFRWLADPQRTPQEFSYVVGPMGCGIFTYNGHYKNLYLGLIAAEALATRNPVLKGAWRHAAWFVVWLNSEYRAEYNYGIVSDNLSEWIIRVMGDPELCPSPPLRMEFMLMFGRMVSINAENGKQALDAIMSACSSVPLDDRNILEVMFGDVSNVSLCSITNVLSKFIASGHLLALDQKLSRILNGHIINVILDVSCSYGLNPNRYTGQRELQMVMWFFHAAMLYTHVERRKYDEITIYP